MSPTPDEAETAGIGLKAKRPKDGTDVEAADVVVVTAAEGEVVVIANVDAVPPKLNSCEDFDVAVVVDVKAVIAKVVAVAAEAEVVVIALVNNVIADVDVAPPKLNDCEDLDDVEEVIEVDASATFGASNFNPPNLGGSFLAPSVSEDPASVNEDFANPKENPDVALAEELDEVVVTPGDEVFVPNESPPVKTEAAVVVVVIVAVDVDIEISALDTAAVAIGVSSFDGSFTDFSGNLSLTSSSSSSKAERSFSTLFFSFTRSSSRFLMSSMIGRLSSLEGFTSELLTSTSSAKATFFV